MIEQEKFNCLLEKVEEALKNEDVVLSFSVLMNWLIVHSTNHFGNISDAHYVIDKLKHQYFEELRKALPLMKKSSSPEK